MIPATCARRRGVRLDACVIAIALMAFGLAAPARAQCPNFTKAPSPSSLGAFSLVIGDFNEDGASDLAIVDGSDYISIFLGTGTGTFGPATHFTVAAPQWIAVGDFNGDGRSDLAVVSGTSKVAILLGTGTGTFGAATYFGVGALPRRVAVGDFNGDGASDIATANEDSSDISILLGNGDGTFGAATNFPVSNAYSVAVGDFNGDGRSDLAVSRCCGALTVAILLGTGTGTFGAPAYFPTGSSSYSVAIGDFNGDGRSDVVTANQSDSVSILLGNGDGTLRAPTTLATGTLPMSVAIGDFNGDGASDIATANEDSSDVSILLGNGDGTFGAATNFAAGGHPGWVAIGDFNGDGRSDVVTANQTDYVSILLNTPCPPVVTSIHPSTGPTGGGTVVTITGSNFVIGATTVSFGASAATSVSCSSTTHCTATSPAGSGIVSIRVTTSSGTSADSSADDFTYTAPATDCYDFSPATNFAVGAQPYSVVVGDFNKDGVSDLAVANSNSNSISILLGTGTGTFGAATNFAAGTSPRSVAIGDFNGDGRSDLAVANYGSNSVSILLGTGTGTFGAATNYAVGTNPQSVVIGDFNGDGRSDLAVANFNSNDVSILLGNGDGTLGAARNFAAGTNPQSVAIGDFNGDGRSDLAIANANGFASVLFGTGTGTFGAPTNYAMEGSPSWVAVGDFNGDGASDLAVANQTFANYNFDSVSILLGTGTGTFGAVTHYPVGFVPDSVAIGDFNGDGASDLAVANSNSDSVSILLGTGTGTFGDATDFPAGTTPRSVAIGDFNGDGRSDLAVANRGSNNVSILLNAPETFSISSATASVNEAAGTLTVTVNRTGGTDCTVSVSYTTANTSAIAGLDYTASSGTLTFGPGVTSQTFAVPITNDTLSEANETFTVAISNPTGGATLGSTPVQTVTIIDDDPVPALSIGNVTQAEGNSGTTNFVFTVTLAPGSGQTVAVNFATADGSATTADGDYTATSGTLTFAPGETSKTITVTVNGDTKFEPDETFAVNLSAASNATISTGIGTGTIQNDDSLPSISINSVSLPEGNSGTSPSTFTVSLSNPSFQTVTVNYATADGTATNADSDYVATSGGLTFAPGETSKTIAVTVNGDTKFETDEAFAVNLSNPTNATIGTAAGTGTIQNDDSLPAISINSVSLPEGNSGTSPFTFIVSLSNPSFQTVTVNYATADGTATAGSDYTATSGTLTFAPGMTTQTVTVLVSGDTTTEADEMFTVTLSAPANATITTATGTGTIQNDEGVPILSINNVTQAEGNSGTTNFVFTVTLTGSTAQTVAVNFATANGTATAGSDYTATNGTLTFAPGTTTQTVTVPVTGDTANEPDETFTVTLSGASNAVIATPVGTGTITNDDPLPALSINNVTQAEGNSGTTNFVFTVTLAPASGQTVTANFETADGTATAGSDYTATNGTLTFAPGTTTQTITVPVIGDTTTEPSETFTVTLSAPANATITTATGTGTIQNDEGVPILSINNVTQAEGNSGTTNFVFTVTLSGSTVQIVAVNFATGNGTATAGSDYTVTNGTLTFAPGTTTQTVTVPVIGDTANEPDETFTVTLSGAINAVIATATGTGTIVNDDAALADLSIVKTIAGSGPFFTNQNATFNIAVTNHGPAAAANVTVVDVLPAGTTFVSAIPTQGSCFGAATITCDLGTLANGVNATIQFVVRLDAAGNITNTAAVTSTTQDPATTNNSSSAAIVVIHGAPIPTLSDSMLIALAALLAAVALMTIRS